MEKLTLLLLPQAFSVCRLHTLEEGLGVTGCFFLARTADEISLVCETAHAPTGCRNRDDGWRGLRVAGTLDFSLTGVLAGLSGAVDEACKALEERGYTIQTG